MMSEKNDWLKKSLSDKFDLESAPVGEELWSKIEPRIQQKPKRKRFLWIWLLFAAFGLGATGLVIWNYTSATALMSHNEKEVSNKKENIILEKKVSELKGLEKNENSTTALTNDADLKNIPFPNEEVNTSSNIEKNITSREKGVLRIQNSTYHKIVSRENSEKTLPNNDGVGLTEIDNNTSMFPTKAEQKNSKILNEHEAEQKGNEIDSQNTKTENLEFQDLQLLEDKLDYPLVFDQVPEFRLQGTRRAKKPPKKNRWYAGLGWSLHRQLIFPNRADSVLIRPVLYDTLDQEKKLQFGISLRLGRTFELSKKLEGFSEISFGLNYLSHFFNRLGRTFNFSSLDSLDPNTIRLNVQRDYRDILNDVRFASAGLKLGVNYKPLERIPVHLTIGALGQYNISSEKFRVKSHFEYGLLAGLGWEMGKKERFILNVRTDLPFNKIFWGWDGDQDLYQSRRQSLQFSLNYKF